MEAASHYWVNRMHCVGLFNVEGSVAMPAAAVGQGFIVSEASDDSDVKHLQDSQKCITIIRQHHLTVILLQYMNFTKAALSIIIF